MGEQIPERKYWAFISYSHQDAVWGDWLHKRLETYKVPKKLIGRPNRTGQVPKRLYPIFRDREELPTSANLGSIIQRGLENSEYLVVICSPRSAASLWVNQEILTFKAMGKADRVLALIVDGEPNASNKPGRENEECFPEALRFHVNEDGSLSDLPAEPVAGDARPFADGKRNALLKLLAGLLGVDYAILNDREHKRRLRRYLMASTVFFLAVFAALAIWGVQEQRRLRDLEIEHQKTLIQRNKALRNLASIYLKEGQQALTRGEAGPALLRLEASLRSYDSLGARVCSGFALPGFVPELASFPAHQGQVYTLAFNSQDGGSIITSGLDDAVKVTRLGGLESTAVFSPALMTYALAVSPQGHILTAAIDGVHDLDPKTRENALIEGVSCPGCTYALAPNHPLIAINDPAQGGVRVVEAPSGQLVAKVAEPFQASGIMGISPDGRLLALGGADGTVLLWDIIEDNARGRLTGFSGPISALAFSPDSGRLAAGEGQFLGGPGAVQVLVWDLDQGENAPPLARLKGHEQQINHLAFSPEGRLLVSNSLADKTLRFWDVARFNPELFKNPLFVFHPLASLPQEQALTALGFSTDGSLLAAGDITGRLRFFYTANLAGRQPPFPDFSQVAVSESGLAALLLPGGTVKIMNTQDFSQTAAIETEPAAGSIALSQDGAILAWAGDGQVVVYDISSQKSVRFDSDLPVQAMAVSKTADALVLAGPGEIRVHSITDGSLRFQWKATAGQESNTASLAVDTDSGFLALGGNFGPKVLDLQNGGPQPVSGYEQLVASLAFSPARDGQPGILLAGCLDGLIRRWSVGDWQQLAPLRGHPQVVAALAASSDGRLYASNAGASFIIWSAPDGEQLHKFQTNLLAVDGLDFSNQGHFLSWHSGYINEFMGANLERGPLESLLQRLESALNLGFPYTMDVNGELAPQDPVELARKRLEAVRRGSFPWPLDSTGLTEASLAKALEYEEKYKASQPPGF